MRAEDSATAKTVAKISMVSRRPAEVVIRDARDKLVSESCPPASAQRLN
jgi:hypothetical protein